jgi:UDP-MurNAc hydroxylase
MVRVGVDNSGGRGTNPSIQFVSNACVVIDISPARILCDPWLTDGAFDGSWFHFPPLRTTPADLQDITHIYLSHIHPDHFDPVTLKELPKVPVILCGSAQPWLRHQVEALGFPTLEIAPGESAELAGGVRVWMFGSFTANPLWSSDVPNVIDSAIVVENGLVAILNANDNTPDNAACEALRRFGTFDVALLPYSGASEYPSCFDALGNDGKRDAASQKIGRYLDRLEDNARILQPRIIVPFAGQYILGGREVTKNPYLGVGPVEDACARLERAGFSTRAMQEGDVLNIASGAVHATLEPVSLRLADYERDIAAARYWYDDVFRFDDTDHGTDLFPLMVAARDKLWQYQERFGWFDNHNLVVRTPDVRPARVCFNFSTRTVDRLAPDADVAPPFVEITARYNLLLALLTRHVNWNNAAIGCHLTFIREPERYQPEVFALLPFFHI